MVLEVLLLSLGLAQQPPVPRPFPQPGGTQSTPPAQPTQKPTPPAAPAQTPAAPSTTTVPASTVPAPPSTTPPSEELLGVKVHPSGQFIGSYDAGRGQRFYLYGSTLSFVELVTYYRTL